MKGTIQKWKLVILLDALLFLSNMTFAKDTINQYTEGNPIDTTAVSISDKTNFPDRLYVDSLSLKRHFIHRIGIEARPGYIFPTSSFFRGENLNWKPIENSLSLHLKYSFQFHPNTYNDRIYRGAYQGIGVGYYNMYEKSQPGPDGQPMVTMDEVIHDISFTAKAGQKTALVGESGSGKSTLAKLLIHYYDPQQGSISIGGQKITEMSLEALNSQVSYVAQPPSFPHSPGLHMQSLHPTR